MRANKACSSAVTITVFIEPLSFDCRLSDRSLDLKVPDLDFILFRLFYSEYYRRFRFILKYRILPLQSTIRYRLYRKTHDEFTKFALNTATSPFLRSFRPKPALRNLPLILSLYNITLLFIFFKKKLFDLKFYTIMSLE